MRSASENLYRKRVFTNPQLKKGIIDEFELGYAPNEWDALLQYMNQLEGISSDLLVEGGLVVPRKGQNGFYDRFRNRIIVPIRDLQGRVIGFGGRSLDGSEPCLLYTSPSPRDATLSRMPSWA